jgi:hypothetical protein
MSQSDYIKFKKTATKLSVDNRSVLNKESPVFNASDYLDFKQFNIENTVVDTNVTYNYIKSADRQIVFNMDKVVSSCPKFIVCTKTNTRPNRVPMSASYFTPTPQPLNWLKENALNNKRFTKCGCNTHLYKN